MSERVHPLTYAGSLITSAGAAVFLIWLIYFHPTSAQPASWVNNLPYLNALFNSLSATHLALGWKKILQRQREAHRSHMLQALLFSALFLVSYVLYHSFHGETRFPQLGWIRSLYLAILFSHIGLSILILPIILITFTLALTGKFEVHPRFGRIALPVWLYVSVTGVIIVFFLKAFVPS